MANLGLIGDQAVFVFKSNSVAKNDLEHHKGKRITPS